jgi:hypothetical protein
LTNRSRPPIVGSIPKSILSAGEVAVVYENRESLANVLTVVLPIAAWCAWWLWCVNWTKLWPVLARGAWAAVVLFILMGGVVWGRVDPMPLTWSGYYIPALTWHLGATMILAAVALLCGWLQGVLGWAPPEFPVHPAPAAHGHDHGPAHH